MQNARLLTWFGPLTLAAALAACSGGGAAGGLVVIPPALEKATAPDGKYKQVHAVYLYDIGYVHFDPIDIGNTYYPSYVFTRFARIKLLTRAATEGYHYGNIFIRHYGDLYKIDAHIEKPDGKRVDLTKNDSVTTVLVKDVIPDIRPPIDFKETTIIFPGLDPGDIIVYSYTMRGRQLTWNFNHVDAPVEYSKFMVARPPQRTEIQPLIFDRHSLNPEKSEDKGMATGMAGYMSISRQATYDIWTARDVPPITFERAMPPPVDLASRLRVWQGLRKWDWNTLGTTYYKWFTHYGRPPSVAKDLVAKVIEGISDPRERARAVHDWVKQNLVIQASIDSLSWVPREIEITTIDIEELFKEKNATPEQAANLMWLMMNAAGIDATLVLTTPSYLPPTVEGLHDLYQFTTPLLALDDGTLIDATDRFTPFGQVPWYFEGRKSLWCKGSTVSFRDLPESPQAANKRIITIDGKVDAEGNAKVDARFHMTGQMALAFRKYFGPMKPNEREKAVRDLITLASEKAEVGEFTFTNMDKPDQPLDMVVAFDVPGYTELLRDKMVMKLGAFVHHTACPILRTPLGDYEYICPKPTDENRKNPVQFSFKHLEEMDVKIHFPLGFSLQALPKGFRTREIEKGTAVGVQTSYGAPDGKFLHVIRKFSTNEKLIDKAGYPNMVPLIQRYQAQKDTLITLELPKMD